MKAPIFTAGLLGCALTVGPVAAQQRPEQGLDDGAAFVAWAAEAAIPVDLRRGIDPQALAPLVAGKRFVFLGEPDHFIHEKYPFRLGFLRALHALGWRHLGMEMGRSDGLRLDRYLEGGDESDLLSVGLYSSISSSPGAPPPGSFLGMELEYARGLRAIAAGPERVRYFGFDLDMIPGNGIEDARARLAGVEAAEELALVLEDAWGSDRRADELQALLEELRDPDSTLATGLPPARRSALVLDLEVLAESLRFRAGSDENQRDVDGLLEAYARRERTMQRLFDAYVDRLPDSARVALTGHNLHLGRSWKDTRWLEIGSSYPVPLWPTIGAHVTERFGDEVFAVWLVYDQGEHLAASSSRTARALESVPGTVESLLARLPHDAVLLPLRSEDPRSAWLDQVRSFRVNGGVGYGRLRELTDALLWVREVSPPRPGR